MSTSNQTPGKSPEKEDNTTFVLRGVFKQIDPSTINVRRLADDLGITVNAAGKRLRRAKVDLGWGKKDGESTEKTNTPMKTDKQAANVKEKLTSIKLEETGLLAKPAKRPRTPKKVPAKTVNKRKKIDEDEADMTDEKSDSGEEVTTTQISPRKLLPKRNKQKVANLVDNGSDMSDFEEEDMEGNASGFEDLDCSTKKAKKNIQMENGSGQDDQESQWDAEADA